jgi:phosphomannomutase
VQDRKLFGTSGIRGMVNDELSPDFYRRVGLAIGSRLAPASTVCIATDTRLSRDMIKGAVVAGLLSCGINVVDSGILPTPALALLTRELGFATGIMVTASHNPPEFNGIKLFTDSSLGYSEGEEGEIEKIFFEKRFRGGKRGTLERAHDMKQRYLSFIENKLSSMGLRQEAGEGGGGEASGRFGEDKAALVGFGEQPGVAGGGEGGRFDEDKLSSIGNKQQTDMVGGQQDRMFREGKPSSMGFRQEPGEGSGREDHRFDESKLLSMGLKQQADVTDSHEDRGRSGKDRLSAVGFKQDGGMAGGEEDGRSGEGRLLVPRFDRGLKVVVDPGNGAASRFASDIFAHLGVNVIPINDEPDGLFPGRSPEPKEDTIAGTVDFLRKHNADLAVCFDGDADRVVFCDKEGFLGFNEPIAFISRVAVERTGRKKIATTVETGALVDLSVKDLGAEVVRGRVGDVPVAHLVKELDAALGVEQVGVYIFPELGYYPDSIFAALFLLSQISDAGEIRRFFRNMPRLFFEKAKVSCPNELKEPVMAQVRENAQLFAHDERPSRIGTLDGLRLDFSDSWVLMRASGTEPLIRVISESTTQKQTKELIRRGKEIVQSLVNAK